MARHGRTVPPPSAKEWRCGGEGPAARPFSSASANLHLKIPKFDYQSPIQLYSLTRMQKITPINQVNVIFRAFSDPTRLRILNLLKTGELCVCDLVRVINAPQPTISRHLAYLRRAKLVRSRKEGLWMHYKLAPAQADFHRKLLDCLSCCFTEVPQLTADAKYLKKCCANGSCCT
jgi:ArsR family transcriptional regulator, arsenate/arsenite/antimonite-responsive transcriptional repressor